MMLQTNEHQLSKQILLMVQMKSLDSMLQKQNTSIMFNQKNAKRDQLPHHGITLASLQMLLLKGLLTMVLQLLLVQIWLQICLRKQLKNKVVKLFIMDVSILLISKELSISKKCLIKSSMDCNSMYSTRNYSC